ncbi:chemotaxis protein CheB [Halomicronema sp. CCY15110]|uniref:chemotaxis protein CheB n=1 Tax=Halomicronema sp. CCY15110 TaxID=2767773 RepID=UPI00194E6620|nr:chemotaxis protein CheB [Halomicronema sp. CCY15110]
MTSANVPSNTDDLFPVVGIGASAGGLEAYTELLSHLPPNPGMAFVLVQHLEPHQPSALGEILARVTELPVHVVMDGLAVAPNQIYVIPPNTVMTIASGQLRLQPRQQSQRVNRVVDIFFESLAQDRGNQAIGIVLSGFGDDGALGLEAIKAAGGITMAQTEDSAQSSGMPQRAIATHQVDFVLPPAEIAQKLVTMGSEAYLTQAIPPKAAPAETSEPDSFTAILNMLRVGAGIDFSQYKPTTLQRRMARRMALHHLPGLADYLQFLQGHPEEVQVLCHEILISVTSFFRDSATFEALKQKVLPQLLQNRDRHDPIRVWVAGCSTGQEAYSIAIVLLEVLANQPVSPPIQIFATDISETAIGIARQGLYSSAQVADLSPDRLQRFFVATEGGYHVNSMVREICIFACQNLISDPPFSRLDLISCRNVLIYFGSALQAKVLPMFHYGLKPQGVLLLGSSETVGDFGGLFTLVDRSHKFYVKQAAAFRLPLDLQDSPLAQITSGVLPEGRSVSERERDVERATNDAICRRYQPTGVVINGKLAIVQFRGQTGPYLEPTPGRASLNLLQLVKDPLRLDLRTLIYQAEQSGQAESREGIAFHEGDRQRQIRIDVIPFSVSNYENYYLVLFEDCTVPPSATATTLPPLIQGAEESPEATRYRQEIERLQQDLETTRSHLQAIIEEREFANQDLRAANEEILSSNEELQSTNEELQTAKEEIQATNEELGTINDELYRRNAEASRIGDDFQNLLGSINIPVLMVGNDLHIRRFTPAAVPLFNLIPSDIGRPLGDINHCLAIADLEAQILAVIDTLSQTTQEIQDDTGRWYQLQLRPYRTLDHRIDGAVIILIDIDRLKRNTAALQVARDFADAIVQTVREALVVLNGDLHVVMANGQFYQTFQVASTDTENRSIFELGNGQWNIPQLRSLLEEILPENHRIEGFEVTHNFEHIGPKTMMLNAQTMAQPDGEDLILLAIEERAAKPPSET